jgi:hypothetical protein
VGVFLPDPMRESDHPRPEGPGRSTPYRETKDAFSFDGTSKKGGRHTNIRCFHCNGSTTNCGLLLEPRDGRKGSNDSSLPCIADRSGGFWGAFGPPPAFAMEAGSCLSVVHCWEETTVARIEKIRPETMATQRVKSCLSLGNFILQCPSRTYG